VAAGRAIVTEPLRYTLPGGFEEGKNYKTYTSPAECETQLRQLLADPAAILAMAQHNAAYYQAWLRPEQQVRQALRQLETGERVRGEKRGMEEQKRHSGFETMRILSMVMIVLMHGIGHGRAGQCGTAGVVAFWIYWLLFIWRVYSTNCL